MRVSTIILDHAPDASERESIKASFEEEGYQHVRFTQVSRWRGVEFVFNVTAEPDSNPYERQRGVDSYSTHHKDLR